MSSSITLAGKGEADAVERLLRVGALRTTVISRFELLSGARNPKQLARRVQLLGAVPSLEPDDPAGHAGGEIRRSVERSGKSIRMAEITDLVTFDFTGYDLAPYQSPHTRRSPMVCPEIRGQLAGGPG